MKKISLFLLCALAIFGCSKKDPILPGTRYDIFDNDEIKVSGKDVPDLSEKITNISGDENCDYRQDSNNTIWFGNRRVYSGFSGNGYVASFQSPICVGGYAYTGLSTGEIIKLNKNKLIWKTDVYKENSLTGGTPVVDIVAHVGVDKNYVYAGSLGDAFCKLNANTGNKIWCLDISVGVDFIMVDDFIFVVGTDNNLYSINKNNGEVYWKTEIKKQVKPNYDGKFITVGKYRINYKNGALR
ncbi:MAG: PQQ-binding-like beta-propeller repeat protein [Alphaproteobacteria bacterium]|nr:PQQ-binding-like beta-propeller repeat protein [Alphaproteobacteria bacterium]